MKRGIFFTWTYLDTKKLNKTQEEQEREDLLQANIVKFKQQLKPFFDKKEIKIINQYCDTNEIVIEFNEKIWDTLNAALIEADIVEIIDSILREK